MREEYDFSNAVKNPYVGKLKQQITIRLDEQVIEYFKKMAEETGMPYQNIINYYLLECVKEKKHMEVAFAKQKHITRISNPTNGQAVCGLNASYVDARTGALILKNGINRKLKR